MANVTVDGVRADFVKAGIKGVRGEQVAEEDRARRRPIRSRTGDDHPRRRAARERAARLRRSRSRSVVPPLHARSLDVSVRNFTNEKKRHEAGKRRDRRLVHGYAARSSTRPSSRRQTRAEFSSRWRSRTSNSMTLNDLLRARGARRQDVAASLSGDRGPRRHGRGRYVTIQRPRRLRHAAGLRQEHLPSGVRGIVGGIGTLLRTGRATRSRPAPTSPAASRAPRRAPGRSCIGLIQNAFIQAILPGLERDARSRLSRPEHCAAGLFSTIRRDSPQRMEIAPFRIADPRSRPRRPARAPRAHALSRRDPRLRLGLRHEPRYVRELSPTGATATTGAPPRRA